MKIERNTLFYGDNLNILRDYIEDNSIDLIYLDPPFNSKATYNILFKELTGEPSQAQITAFEDTWHWTEETQKTFEEIVNNAPHKVVDMIKALRDFIGCNDMMAYLVMMAVRLQELHRVLKPTGSIYLHCDPTASHYLKLVMDAIFGFKYFRNEIIWRYRRWPTVSKDFQRMHDIILRYSKHEEIIWNQLHEKLSESSIRQWKGKVRVDKKSKRGTRYSETLEKDSPGVRMSDVWEISQITAPFSEYLGYPTQKPEALLERIIKASSNEGDVILDPFCGCGTAIVAAEKLKRKWIGIDITHLAINLIKWRVENTFGIKAKKDYEVIGEPEDLAGARELFSQNAYQFQWWALSLINARPYKEKKKGADTGIDGYIYYMEGKDIVKKAIVQIKGGHVSVSQIRDLAGVMEREKANIAIFLTLEPPTNAMRKEAAIKGFYKPPKGDFTPFIEGHYPRIQIYTIEEILKGKKPKLPIGIIPFKRAERHKQDQKSLSLYENNTD